MLGCTHRAHIPPPLWSLSSAPEALQSSLAGWSTDAPPCPACGLRQDFREVGASRVKTEGRGKGRVEGQGRDVVRVTPSTGVLTRGRRLGVSQLSAVWGPESPEAQPRQRGSSHPSLGSVIEGRFQLVAMQAPPNHRACMLTHTLPACLSPILTPWHPRWTGHHSPALPCGPEVARGNAH